METDGGGKSIITASHHSRWWKKSAWPGDWTITLIPIGGRLAPLFLNSVNPPPVKKITSHFVRRVSGKVHGLMLFAWNQPKSNSRHFLTLILSCMCQSFHYLLAFCSPPLSHQHFQGLCHKQHTRRTELIHQLNIVQLVLMLNKTIFITTLNAFGKVVLPIIPLGSSILFNVRHQD